jgi:type III pantothenate kinase
MILILDVGNTNITLGLFSGKRCTHFWRLSSDIHRTEDEYAIAIHNLLAMSGLRAGQINHVVLGSVVPVLSETLHAACERATGCEPFHVTHQVKLPVVNRYANPTEVGIDRLANAAGGVALFGAPLIVVDLGTAVTLDVITRDREYLGGAILPGIAMSAEALARRTARLPLISAQIPERTVGRTTVESIRSGILHGLVGAVDRLIERIWKELGYETATVATGGLAIAVIGESNHVHKQEPNLTLIGLKGIYDLNRKPGKTARKRSG